MNAKELRAIDANLPLRYRGRGGHRAMLDSLTLRISVSGTRGKSILTKRTAEALHERGLSVYAKVTGTDPLSFKDGHWNPIKRDRSNKAILEENIWEVKRYWPMDAAVMENQGITPYTMTAFNELFARPNYLFIPNVRRDHAGDLARSLPRMAKAFAHSAPRKTTIVNGERDRQLARIMAKVAKERGCRFLNAAPRRMEVPGYENLAIIDTFLQDWMGEGLTRGEKTKLHTELVERFTWEPSSIPGVMWFHGAEINDIDSTHEVFRYLQSKKSYPTTMVAYFRRDRTDRTATFIPFLRDKLKEGEIERVVVAGHRSDMVARILRKHGEVWRVKEEKGSVEQLMKHLSRDTRGGAVMTVANAVPPWPRAFSEAMRQAPASEDEQPNPQTASAPGPVHQGRTMTHRLQGVTA